MTPAPTPTPTLSELVDACERQVIWLAKDGYTTAQMYEDAFRALRAALRARPGVDAEPVIRVCCGEYATCTRPCTPRGRWLAGGHPCDTNAIPAPPTQVKCPVCGSSDTQPHKYRLCFGCDTEFADADDLAFNKRRSPQTAPPTQGASYTYGHCENRKQIGGCHLHNLHCGYPDCDRRAAPPAQPAKPGEAMTVLRQLREWDMVAEGPQACADAEWARRLIDSVLTRPPSAQKEDGK